MERLGAVLGRLGGVLGASWRPLGGVLERPVGILKVSWGIVRRFGASWARHRASGRKTLKNKRKTTPARNQRPHHCFLYIYTPSPPPERSGHSGDFGHFGHFGDFGHCHGSLHQFYHQRDFFGPWSWGGTVGTAGLPQNGPFVCFESICCGAVHLFLCCGSSFPLFCKHLVTSGAVCAAVAVLFWFVL